MLMPVGFLSAVLVLSDFISAQFGRVCVEFDRAHEQIRFKQPPRSVRILSPDLDTASCTRLAIALFFISAILLGLGIRPTPFYDPVAESLPWTAPSPESRARFTTFHRLPRRPQASLPSFRAFLFSLRG